MAAYLSAGLERVKEPRMTVASNYLQATMILDRMNPKSRMLMRTN